VTARIASPALADVSRWLTGQMPQTRAVMPAISQSGRPTQNRSKPRKSVTWNRASHTCPSSPSWMVILAWPSIRVTGSITICSPTTATPQLFASRCHEPRLPSAKLDFPTLEVRSNACQDLFQDGSDPRSRRRTSRHVGINLYDTVHRKHRVQQRGHNSRLGGNLGIPVGLLDVRLLEYLE